MCLTVSYADVTTGEIASFTDGSSELNEYLDEVALELKKLSFSKSDLVTTSEDPSRLQNWEADNQLETEEGFLGGDDFNTGISSSFRPHIPEPMVFDLIRPLGARQHELEINTLALRPFHQGSAVDWAPEIEYAFLDNHAVEFELPFENTRLQMLKGAYQITFGTGLRNRLIHGAQLIGKYDLHQKKRSVDGLYLVGMQLSPRWSTLWMGGLRHTHFRSNGLLQGMVNPSVFYSHSKRFRLGLETNLVIHRKQVHHLYMPQVHWEIGKRYSLQLGMGVEAQGKQKLFPVMGLRLIHEL